MSTKLTLAEEALGSPLEESSKGHRKGPKRATADGEKATEIWNRGIEKLGARKVAAQDLGVSEQHLSDYCSGRSTLAFHRVVLVCRRARVDENLKRAALEMLTELAELSDLVPPRLKLVADRKQVRQRYIDNAREIELLHEANRRRTAHDMGTDEEQVDMALEETNPRIVMEQRR